MKRLESSIEGAHFVSRHGPQTTLGQQRLRATYGIAPDNPNKVTYTTDTARWFNSGDMFEGLQRAQAVHARTGDPEIFISFDRTIGEGYLKGGDIYATSNTAVFRFNEHGQPYTFYPILDVK